MYFYIYSREKNKEMIVKDGLVIYEGEFGTIMDAMVNKMWAESSFIHDYFIGRLDASVHEAIEFNQNETIAKVAKDIMLLSANVANINRNTKGYLPVITVLENDKVNFEFIGATNNPFRVCTLSELERNLSDYEINLALNTLKAVNLDITSLKKSVVPSVFNAFAFSETTNIAIIIEDTNMDISHIFYRNTKHTVPSYDKKAISLVDEDGWDKLAGHVMREQSVQAVSELCPEAKTISLSDVRNYILGKIEGIISEKDLKDLLDEEAQIKNDIQIYQLNRSLFNEEACSKIIVNPFTDTYSIPKEYEPFYLSTEELSSTYLRYFTSNRRRKKWLNSNKDVVRTILSFLLFSAHDKYGSFFSNCILSGDDAKEYCSVIEGAIADYSHNPVEEFDFDNNKLYHKMIDCIKETYANKYFEDSNDVNCYAFCSLRGVFSKKASDIFKIISDKRITSDCEYRARYLNDRHLLFKFPTFKDDGSFNHYEKKFLSLPPHNAYEFLKVLTHVKGNELNALNESCQKCKKAFFRRNSADKYCPVCAKKILIEHNSPIERLKLGQISGIVKKDINNKRNHFINYLGNVFPENWYEIDKFVKIYKCALAFEYNRALMRIKEYDSTLGKRISIINRYYNEQLELNPKGANPEPTPEQLEAGTSITHTLFYYKITKNTDLKPKFFEYTTKKYYEQEPICHTKSGKEILKYLNLLPEAEDKADATVNHKTNDDRDKLIDYIKECLEELNENYGKAKIEDAFLRDLLEEYHRQILSREKCDKER